jgi:predicted nuclease of restriction endonuclease-like (RecB) superfamily
MENKLQNTEKNSIFFENVAMLIEQARQTVTRTVDLTMCVTYFELGRMIVEREQEGKIRAEYGKSLIKELADFLANRFGKGFSETNLRNARKFYIVYLPEIQQSMTSELQIQKQQKASAELQIQNNQSTINSLYPFKLSWSHYLILMRIKNENERKFYEIESANENWSVPILQRQYNSSLYERIALSKDKDEVLRLSREGHTVEKPQDLLRNPLALEFLGIDKVTAYTETKLETAIINKLQQFLLEMGKGFLFEARQKRFTFDEEHFFVDLVFYNRLLQCYVLIDLKTDKLKHQDLGQMQMYVNYFDRFIKRDFEKPTVGILLCKEKKDTMVQLTLPENANIFASEYTLYLPEKALLQQKLQQWTDEFENNDSEEKL